MVNILGFDSSNALVSGSTTGVSDASATVKGIIQLAGDLEGTADAPKLKMPPIGPVDKFLGYTTLGFASSDLPAAMHLTKGVIQLAGDITGTAELPKVRKPADDTIAYVSGFNTSGTFCTSTFPTLKDKTMYLRVYNAPNGTMEPGLYVPLFNITTQLTTYNGVALDTTTSALTTTGNMKYVKEIFSVPGYTMKWISIRITLSRDVPFTEELTILATLNRAIYFSVVSQVTAKTSTFSNTISLNLNTFVLGVNDPYIIDGYYLNLYQSGSTPLNYSSITVTVLSQEEKI